MICDLFGKWEIVLLIRALGKPAGNQKRQCLEMGVIKKINGNKIEG